MCLKRGDSQWTYRFVPPERKKEGWQCPDTDSLPTHDDKRLARSADVVYIGLCPPDACFDLVQIVATVFAMFRKSPFLQAAGVGLFIIFNIVPTASSQLIGSGLSVVLNNIDYYISPVAVDNITSDLSLLSSIDSIYGFAPVTIVQDSVTSAELVALFNNWTDIDDVFQSGFTGAVFLGSDNQSKSVTRAAETATTYQVSSINSTAPSGPYFVESSTGALHRVYRLYDDFAGSFTTPLLQTVQGTFQPLSAQIASSATMTIGVPSRLYFTKTVDQPLAGVRIGVKVC